MKHLPDTLLAAAIAVLLLIGALDWMDILTK